MSRIILNASKLLSDQSDRHMNVFIQYRGEERYEDNLTKALIHTFQSLCENDKNIFCHELFEITLEPNGNSFKYFLQKGPEPEVIKQFSAKNRKLFAFSPTGKSWGTENIDTGNEASIRKSIHELLLMSNPDISDDDLKKEIEVQTNEILDIIEDRGEPRPDAWILVYNSGKPQYCIAFEDKLYDLNPFQLNNHCKKALFLEENKIVYHTYREVIETLSNMDGYLVGDYLRYMNELHYWDVTAVSELEGMTAEQINQYAKKCCYELLIKIGRGVPVTRQRGWMNRILFDMSENGRCINMIGLDYREEKKEFSAVLVFAPTQKTAKSFYSLLEQKGYSLVKEYTYSAGFHFNILGGLRTPKDVDAQLRVSQELDTVSAKKYIDFWCKNTQEIKVKDKKERAKLLKGMRDGGVLSQSDYKKLKVGSDAYKSSQGNRNLEIRPEFIVTVNISFDEAVRLDKLGEDVLADTFRNKIKHVYQILNVAQEPWM